MKLGEKFDVSIGLVLARKKAKQGSANGYRYKLLTLRSVLENGELDYSGIEEFISESEVPTAYLTQSEDIIVKLTEPYSAIYIQKTEENLLVPSNFAIIRNYNREYNPEFIKYYLNSLQGKNAIRRMAAGSALNAISIASLREIEIGKYSKKQQEKFITINKLFIQEKYLLEQFMQEREKQLQGLNQQILKQERV